MTTESTAESDKVACSVCNDVDGPCEHCAPTPFSPDCDACYWEQKGWGGSGCCETCDRYSYEHTCAEPTKEKQ